jgi:hypothetical protein
VITTDAQISIYNAKYKYLFWRPSTAIIAGNYLQDPAWTSFWAAPQHPEYPSGHGGQVGSQQGVLDAFLGPRPPAPLPLSSPDALGVTRTYTHWKTITDDVINARVWEGVHFRTSDVTGSAKACAWPAGKWAASQRSACKETRCLDPREARIHRNPLLTGRVLSRMGLARQRWGCYKPKGSTVRWQAGICARGRLK